MWTRSPSGGPSHLLLLVLAPCLAACRGGPAPAAERSSVPVVATHYFYWYRWPSEHFDPDDDPRREGHRHHFLRPRQVSYLDPGWHERQFRAMAACGIDVALPVYWGAPGAHDRPGLRFARAGLGPMVAALDRIRAGGDRAVRLGLFYDTSTLLHDVRGVAPPGERADLRTPEGERLFCETVLGFFAEVPRRWWARVRGGALVVLYSSGFAAGWEPDLGAALRRAFAARFGGDRPFLVADASWGDIGQDRTTRWGAALAGPQLHDGVAQIGPGYDDTPVPGRRTPIRDREDGDFYRYSWSVALRARPELVLIETWNEMHEGTEICATRETGRLYLEITREWVARLKRGETDAPGIRLARPTPRGRPDTSWGEAARGAPAVRVDYRADRPERLGLRAMRWEDGPFEVRAGRLRARSGERPSSYVYFGVSDHWRYDVREDLAAVVVASGSGTLDLEYDSWETGATLQGSYTPARARRRTLADGTVEHAFALESAMLANRQNGGADFRLVVRGEVAIATVTVR